MFKFVKEVVRFGAVLFAGQLVFEALQKVYSTAKETYKNRTVQTTKKVNRKKK